MPRFFRFKKRRTQKYGTTFDNPDELARYEYLLIRQRAGEISELKDHPVFPIIVDGVHVCDFIPDFYFFDHAINDYVVEDCKPGVWIKKKQTRRGVVIREWKERQPYLEPEYKLKKKLFFAKYEIIVMEIWK